MEERKARAELLNGFLARRRGHVFPVVVKSFERIGCRSDEIFDRAPKLGKTPRALLQLTVAESGGQIAGGFLREMIRCKPTLLGNLEDKGREIRRHVYQAVTL